ncbi:MAG: hypothetical protein H0X51_05380 [Parachlamydiaceae bacterium]|nr:hypothetical protein [Parachlamydiaceae bacterium]
MTSSDDFNMSFSYEGRSYDFSLKKESIDSSSSESIVIAGQRYKLLTDPNESAVIREVLKATSLDKLTSSKDLYDRIKVTLTSAHFSDKINQVSIKGLRPLATPLRGLEKPLDQQTALMNTILQRSLITQFQDYQSFTTFGKAEATVIVGHSTAGKSTLIRAFLQKEPGAVEEGIDKALREQFVKQVEKQFPHEFAIIKGCIQGGEDDVAFLNAIFAPEVLPKYKESVIDDDKHKFTAATDKIRKGVVFQFSDAQINAILLDKILDNSQKGKQTIFDVLQIDGIFQQCLAKNVKLPFRIALAYCPFQKLAERQRIRNEIAMKTNTPNEIRQGVFLFHQFADLFGPKQRQDDLVIEKLNRDLVVQTMKQGFSEEVAYNKKNPLDHEKWIKSLKAEFGSDLSEEDLIAKEMDYQLNQLLEKLGFTSAEIQTVELTPRIQNYHYLLDLSVLSPDQAAEILSKKPCSYHFV